MIVNVHHISVTWSPVVRDKYIKFDLESTPLQIKTDSTAGSGDNIGVPLHKANGFGIGGIFMKFTTPFQYHISYCIGYTPLPVQLPEEVDKIWTIQKTATAFTIHCNGVQVLKYQFSDASYAGNTCVSVYGGDVVGGIKFNSNDDASDSYRAKPAGNEGVEITVAMLP